jgi:cobalt-zinc-cadmium efflux system membrane fusion protein
MKWRGLLVVAMIGCGGKGEKPHDDHDKPGANEEHDDDHGAPEAPGGEHHDEPDEPGRPETVRIAASMIRDLRVTTAKAEARPAGERVSVLGELRVDQDRYAEVASPVSSRVVKVLARAGDEVKLGQPLVELYSADAGRARAEAQGAAARVVVAQRNLDRQRKLAAERLVAERDVVDAEAVLVAAQAERDIAVAAQRGFGGGGGAGGLVLRAPVAGTVIDRDVVVGQLVDASRTLYRIGDLSSLWLVAHVFERDAVRVRIGGAGTATFAALPGRSIDGAIEWVGREVELASRTIPVRLVVPNPDGVLRPGMSAMVSLPLGDSSGTVVAVPLAAVQRVAERWVVFVPREPGVFDIRPVGRGRDLGGEVEILGGLKPGDAVVVDGAFLLKAEADKARGEGGGHDHHH